MYLPSSLVGVYTLSQGFVHTVLEAISPQYSSGFFSDLSSSSWYLRLWYCEEAGLLEDKEEEEEEIEHEESLEMCLPRPGANHILAL